MDCVKVKTLAALLVLLLCAPCRAQAVAAAVGSERIQNALALGDYDAVIESGRRMLERDPADVAALLALGRACSRKGDFSRPLEFYRLGINYTAADDGALFDLATACHAAGREDEALESFARLLALFPERTDAYLAMAEIYAGRENYAAEQKYLRKYMDAGGRPERALYPGAVPYGRRYYYSLARGYFLRALRLAPRDPEVFRAFGRHYLKLSRIYAFEIHREKAVEMLKKSLELDPFQGEVCFDIAAVFRERGEFGQARGYFERSLELGTTRRFDAWFALGDGALAGGDSALARRYYGLCLNLVPMSPHAHERMGEVAAYENKWAEAQGELEWLRGYGADEQVSELEHFIAQTRAAGAGE